MFLGGGSAGLGSTDKSGLPLIKPDNAPARTAVTAMTDVTGVAELEWLAQWVAPWSRGFTDYLHSKAPRNTELQASCYYNHMSAPNE